MSAENPLLINLSQLKKYYLLQILRNCDKAEHVVINFNTDGDNDQIILSDKDENLLDSKESVIFWVTLIAAKLKKLTHVTIKANDCQAPDFFHRGKSTYFPVEALGKIFWHRDVTLVSIQIEGCLNVSGAHNDFQTAMDHLTKVKRLESISLDGGNGGGSDWYATKLKKFRGRLRVVRDNNVSQLWVTDALFSSLLSIGTLKHVALPSSLTAPSAIYCLQTLCDDHHSLESLKLDIRCSEKNDPSRIKLIATMFKEAVAKMKCLEKLTMKWKDVGHRGYALPVIAEILKGLRENQSLTSFVVTSPLPFVWSEADYPSYRVRNLCYQMHRVLEMNAQLTRLDIPLVKRAHGEEKATPDIVRFQLNESALFWLKMNGIGRRRLLDNFLCQNGWRKALVEQKDDLAVTFYLLSTNLSAFLPALLPAASSPQKKQKLNHY